MGLCSWTPKFLRFNQLEQKHGEEGSPVPRASWSSSSPRGAPCQAQMADGICLLRAQRLFATRPPPPVCAQLGALLAWAAPWVLVSASSKCARVGSRGHSQAALSPALLSPCLSDFPSQLSYDTYTSFLLPLLTLSDLRALLQAPSSRKPSRLLSPSPYSFSSLLPSPSFYCLSSK